MKEKLVELAFPLAGLHEAQSLAKQPAGTTPDCLNVVAWDPRSGRNQGGSRSGSTKYQPDQVNGSISIQEISHATMDGSQMEQFGSGLTYLHGTSGTTHRFDIADVDGTSFWGVPGPASGEHGFMDAVFDQENRMYVAQEDSQGPHTAAEGLRVRKYAIDALTPVIDPGSGTQWRATRVEKLTGTKAAPEKSHVIWDSGNLAPASLDASNKSAWGIAVDGYVYVLWNSTGTTLASIVRLDPYTGDVVGTNPWLQSTLFNMRAGYIPLNSGMAIGGGIISIAGYDQANSSVKLTIITQSTGAVVANVTIVAAVTDAGVSDVAVDASGNTYVCYQTGSGTASSRRTLFESHTTEANRIQAWNSSGTSLWTTTTHTAVQSVCWDKIFERLVICGRTLFGTANRSVAIIAAADGTLSSSADPGSITTGYCVRPDGRGGYILGSASGVYQRIDSALAQTWTKTLTGFSGYNIATAAYSSTKAAGSSKRVTRIFAVAGGNVIGFDRSGTVAVASGGGNGALNDIAAQVFATQLGSRVYFADGVNEKRYDPAKHLVETWTASAGTLPTNGADKPRLVEAWRGRLMLSGIKSDPDNYFGSKVNDARDFDYGAATVTELMAFAGNNAEAGRPPDIVNAIKALNDREFIFGCDHSIWQLTGDPMAGGRLNIISDTIGMAWGRPFCRDAKGVLYFFSSRGGVYALAGGEITPISQAIEDRLAEVNIGSTIIRMLWDDRQRGFYLFLTPGNKRTKTTHFFWDQRNQGWWPVRFENTNHNPKSVYIFDGDSPADRALLFGGWDGYVRYLDIDADDDDGEPINSHVLFPVLGAGQAFMLKELQCTLTTGGEPVDWSVQLGDSEQAAFAAAASESGRFTAGRSRSQFIRRHGHAAYVRLSQAQYPNPNAVWSLEALRAVIMPSSTVRQRQVF